MLLDWPEISEEEKLEEFKKCARDFEYFAETYARITHPTKGLVPFKLYDYQRRVVSDFEKYKHNILNKFRQGGLTTLATIWSMWRCMFKLDQRILVLSKSDREAKHAGSLVTNALRSLPPWMQPEMSQNNAHEKIFTETNGSLEFHTPEASRSKSLTYLILDEAAFIKNMDDHWKAMYPTVAAGGRTIIISTVNGFGNWYEEMFHAAQQGKNQFHIIDIDYREHPDYRDPKWAAEMQANLGKKGWQQEVLKLFLGSGETYINGDILTELDAATRHTPPIRKLFEEWENTETVSEEQLPNQSYQRGAMWIWKEPEARHEYILAADSAEGVGEGGDNSAIQVIDVTTNEQVAEFCSNIVPPHLFAQVIYNVGNWYNDALVVVENMGPGLSVVNKLAFNLYYPNLFFESRKTGDKPGISCSQTTRPLFLEALQSCLSNKFTKVYSTRLVRELKTFNYNKTTKKAQAQKNKHDDLILSFCIALHSRETMFRQLPVGVPLLAEKHDEITKSKVFQKIKNELDNGLIEKLLAEEEEYELLKANTDAILVKNLIMEKYRPMNDLLKEFDW